MAGNVPAPGRPSGAQLEWDKPAAWTDQPGSQMRLASYTFAAPDGAKADISVTAFPDAAGGLLANINRWRGQVGLPDVAEADLHTTAQPEQIAGQAGWLVDFGGTPPAGGGPTRIIGAIVPVSGTSWFFKMMGPDAVVVSQREAFAQLVRSIRAITPSMPSTTSAGPVDPNAVMPDDATHAGLAAGANAAAGAMPTPGSDMAGGAAAVPPPPSQPGFEFQAPPGWQEQPRTQFRVVNYIIPGPGVPAAEFYVTPLGGAAGGELGNVNRWRGQLKLPPVTEEELAAMATTVTGPAGTFKVYDLASTGPALKSGEPARMLAAIHVRGGVSWFFRLTGEINHVDTLRGAFTDFLKSCEFATAP